MFVAPKFCISIVFSFSWGNFNSQEKLKTMLMQNFGVSNKGRYGMLWYFLQWSIRCLQGLFYSVIHRKELSISFLTLNSNWPTKLWRRLWSLLAALQTFRPLCHTLFWILYRYKKSHQWWVNLSLSSSVNKGLYLKAVTTATATKASETIREVFSVNNWLFAIYAGEPVGLRFG